MEAGGGGQTHSHGYTFLCLCMHTHIINRYIHIHMSTFMRTCITTGHQLQMVMAYSQLNRHKSDGSG